MCVCAQVCVCVCVLESPNDRLIYEYQQRMRWEAYSCFLKGGGIIVYRKTPERNATGAADPLLGASGGGKCSEHKPG